MKLTALPAFTDNYLWFLNNNTQALVVDPGDSQPVLDALQANGLTLSTILVTHHHADHVGGVARLVEQTGASVYGPAHERMPSEVAKHMKGLSGGDTVTALGVTFTVIDVPGHTAGHIAYYAPSVPCTPEGLAPWSAETQDPLLFCGDTLFSAGCGRLFEGTPAQMLASLDQLAALPPETRVCCTHEYTLSNLRFARAADPNNSALIAHELRCKDARLRNLPTLPSSIGTERAINPFLRSRDAALAQSVDLPANQLAPISPEPKDGLAVFTRLRQWKNDYK